MNRALLTTLLGIGLSLGCRERGRAPDGQAVVAPSWSDEPCADLTERTSAFEEALLAWASRDERGQPEPDRLLIIGSSSVRRWETAEEDLRRWRPVRRGFGGGQMWELARYEEMLVPRGRPSGIVVFAGANDLWRGRSPEDVVGDWRCFTQRVWQDVGDVPLFWVGIPSTPRREKIGAEIERLNQAIEELSGAWPSLHYVDLPEAFLAVEPSARGALFDEDELHPSAEGYALWTGVIQRALEGRVPAASDP